MQFGLVGLGRMGLNVATHAIEQGHRVVGTDVFGAARDRAAEAGVVTVGSIREIVASLEPPRIVMLYVPHGEPTEIACRELVETLQPGDVVADCGNSHWDDSRRRHDAFAGAEVRFLDVGTSGGLEGARRGAAFMAGGDRSAFDLVEPLLRDLAVDERAVLYAGGPGAGHFVKLVHNAIEFGMIQAIAEGVELLLHGHQDVDLPTLFEHWNHGSVIRSWLIELMGRALGRQGDLDDLSSYVEDTGEVKWILEWALARDIPLPVTSSAQVTLMEYRDRAWPQAKAVALLRNAFGGHPLYRRGS